MTDKKIEEYLAQAVSKNTPDILDELLADIDRTEVSLDDVCEEPGKVWEEVRSARVAEPAASDNTPARHRGMRTVMSIAAVFVLLIGGFTIFSRMQQSIAVVGLDVNPSIELSINDREKVTEAMAVNEEGEDILSGIDLKGTDINTACCAVTAAMLSKGYLTNTSNSVLVSVRAANADRGREIEKKLSSDINSYLGDSEIAASVLGQYVEDDDELEAFAEANGISEGKAWLIRSLMASGGTGMTEESLLKLSTQELILLGQEKRVSPDSYGSADTSRYIGRDKAADAALAAAGINRTQASGISVEYDSENGRIVYEVEFMAGGREYEYDIDAVSGKVISYEAEKADGDSDGMDADDRDDEDDRYDDDNDDKDGDDDHDDEDDDDD